MIYLFYPSKKTLTISLTETSCSLMCNHCFSTYLKGMKTKEEALKILTENPGKFKSVLISGGSSREGKVPIAKNIDFIKELHEMGLKLNIHTGLIDEQEIRLIKPYFERVSFDFVYNDRVIKDVYHLEEKGRDDFLKTYLLLRRILGGKIENSNGYPSSRVIPHYTIGLECGRVGSEDYEAMDEFAVINPTLLVINIFVPTKGTPFENCPTPDIEEVRKVFNKAKRKLTKTTLFLGCMRPFGQYRDTVDIAAYEEGFRGFVLPSNALLERIRQDKIESTEIEECCALI